MVSTLDHLLYDRMIKQEGAVDASLVTVDAGGTINLEPNDPVTLPLTIPDTQYTWFMRTHKFLTRRVTSKVDYMEFLRQKKKAQQSNDDTQIEDAIMSDLDSFRSTEFMATRSTA